MFFGHSLSRRCSIADYISPILSKRKKSIFIFTSNLEEASFSLVSLFSRAAYVHLSFRYPFQATSTEREGGKKKNSTLKWIIRVEHAVTDRAKSLWQPQTCIKEIPQRKRERGKRGRPRKKSEKNTRSQMKQ